MANITVVEDSLSLDFWPKNSFYPKENEVKYHFYARWIHSKQAGNQEKNRVFRQTKSVTGESHF